MICRLPQNILHRIAKYILTCSKDTSKSWFFHIRSLCFQYGLPHPLLLLESGPSKESSKKTIKSRVVDFWEKKLRQKADNLPSLSYFKPDYMSLTQAHPLWSTCKDNSFEVAKAIIQAKLLSGRYKTDKLLSHFSRGLDGSCTICQDNCPGTVEHLLVECASLSECRDRQFSALANRDDISDTTKKLVSDIFRRPSSEFVQLLLDCSVLPEVISANRYNTNTLPELFKFTRTWCYNMHMTRLKILGRWNKSFYIS